MTHRDRICPECMRLKAEARELRATLEMTRLDADQAVAEREAIVRALVNLGIDGVVEGIWRASFFSWLRRAGFSGGRTSLATEIH